MDNDMNNGMNEHPDSGMGTQSSFGPGMQEQHQDLGGSPGGIRGMASQAGEKLMDTAEHQKMAGADFIGGLAESVRRAAGEFEGQSPQAASYIRSAADQVETFSESLRRRDVGQMLSDVQSFARRQPTAFLGMSFIAGFAAVRFLRSGSSRAPIGSGSAWESQRSTDDGRYGAASSGEMPGIQPGSGL